MNFKKLAVLNISLVLLSSCSTKINTVNIQPENNSVISFSSANQSGLIKKIDVIFSDFSKPTDILEYVEFFNSQNSSDIITFHMTDTSVVTKIVRNSGTNSQKEFHLDNPSFSLNTIIKNIDNLINELNTLKATSPSEKDKLSTIKFNFKSYLDTLKTMSDSASRLSVITELNKKLIPSVKK